MKRVAVLFVVASALLSSPRAAAAAAADAAGRRRPGSSRRRGRAAQGVRDRSSPTVHLFGDSLTAQLAVVADTKWIDPHACASRRTSRPYQASTTAEVLRLQVGRFAAGDVDVDAPLPRRAVRPRPPNERSSTSSASSRPRRVPRSRTASRAYGINATGRRSRSSRRSAPASSGSSQLTKHINWRFGVGARRRSRRTASRPSLAFWLAIALATLAAAGAVLLGGRWYLAIRPRRRSCDSLPGTPLERALAVLRYAHETGDETLQRKAFERVADELGVQRAGELHARRPGARVVVAYAGGRGSRAVRRTGAQQRSRRRTSDADDPDIHRSGAVPLADLPRLCDAAHAHRGHYASCSRSRSPARSRSSS